MIKSFYDDIGKRKWWRRRSIFITMSIVDAKWSYYAHPSRDMILWYYKLYMWNDNDNGDMGYLVTHDKIRYDDDIWWQYIWRVTWSPIKRYSWVKIRCDDKIRYYDKIFLWKVTWSPIKRYSWDKIRHDDNICWQDMMIYLKSYLVSHHEKDLLIR